MSRYNLIIRWMVLSLIVLLISACGSETQLPAIPKGATVLILGDSLSYGTGADKGQDYPTLLAKNTGWNIINAGVPGDTSSQGLGRLPDLLQTHQPDLLIIELGGNDFLRKQPVSTTIQNLKAIIQRAKQDSIQTLLIAIPDYQPMKAALGGLSDHPLYATLAEETQTPLIEETFTKVLAKNSLKADYVHPNAEGYKVVEENLRESLQSLGLLAQ